MVIYGGKDVFLFYSQTYRLFVLEVPKSLL